MANHRWDYTPVTGAASSLVFTEGARLSGDSQGLKLNQETTLTKGGTRQAKSYGAAKHIWQFTVIFFASSTSIDLADILNWIENVSVGAVNAFVWTDENSTARTVRILSAEFTFPEFGHNTQSCTFQLEEQ